jgi:hypothetical protein
VYAVFRIALNDSALHLQFQHAMAAVWGNLTRAYGGLKVAQARFEPYDDRFDPMEPGSLAYFDIPVECWAFEVKLDVTGHYAAIAGVGFTADRQQRSNDRR